MDIRSAVTADFESLFELHRLVFQSHIDRIWGWDEKWQRSNFQKEFEASLIEVVLDFGIIVGYVQTIEDSKQLYLQNIALTPEVQGLGVGTHLVKKLQKRSVELRLPFELSVFRTNPRAMEFYRRLGFHKIGETETHIRMSYAATESILDGRETESMAEIVLLNPGQYDEVVSLYRHVNYGGMPAHEDLVVGAFVDDQLVGAVRLTSENDFLILRGMHVRKEFQHQGIGSSMLAELQNHFGDRECWCIPYVHLRDFYSHIGFVESPLRDAPGFLKDRLKAYTESGLQIVIMKRSEDSDCERRPHHRGLPLH